MTTRNVCILGGTGFVGRAVCARLGERDAELRVLTRRAARHRELLVLPRARLIEGDVYHPAFLRQQFEGMDAVINLIGILNESGRDRHGFARAHVELPGKIADACRESGVKRLVHMSALHAATHGASRYLRSKAEGEDVVHAAGAGALDVTSFRPSVIFGPGDRFLNRFARLLRLAPGVFPLACPQARLQPIYVDDVAHAFVAALDRHETFGKRYDLCGPKVYTLRDIVGYVARLLGRRVRIIGLSDRLSFLQAAMLEWVPGKPFTLDNYRSLQVDSVCTQGLPAFIGGEPASLETVVPGYLGPDAYAARYALWRRCASRDEISARAPGR